MPSLLSGRRMRSRGRRMPRAARAGSPRVAGVSKRPKGAASGGDTLSPVLEILAATVAEAYRSLSTTGLVAGAEGNVSVAERITGVALVTAMGLVAAEATPD